MYLAEALPRANVAGDIAAAQRITATGLTAPPRGQVEIPVFAPGNWLFGRNEDVFEV